MSSLLQKRFPIGNFKYGKTYSSKDIRGLVKDIQKLPKLLKKTLKKLKGEELDMPYRPGGWSVRQVIHHLADSHMNAYIRFKWAATEDKPIIKPYEEGRWAELWDGKHGHHKLSLDLLEALHKRWTVYLKNLDDSAFERGYFSPHANRFLSLAEALALYAWHGKHHVAHIRLLTGWEPKAIDFEHEAAVSAPEKRKRGPKPGAKKAVDESTKTATEPVAAKRKRRTKEEIAADNAAKAAAPKRLRRSSEEVAAEKAAKAALPKMSIEERLAKARAAAAANRAARGNEPKPKKVKAATESKPQKEAAAPKRPRRSSEEVAAEKAAKAALPKMSIEERLAKARAAAAANRAARGIETRPKKEATGPKRVRRSKEEIEADKARLAAEKAARPPQDKVAQMAKARAVRAANIAARLVEEKGKS